MEATYGSHGSGVLKRLEDDGFQAEGGNIVEHGLDSFFVIRGDCEAIAGLATGALASFILLLRVFGGTHCVVTQLAALYRAE